MDVYPPDYISHNFPFVVLSGFNTENTPDNLDTTNTLYSEDKIVVDSDWPVVDTERSRFLLQELLDCHADTDATLPRSAKKNGSAPSFYFKVTGRVGMFIASCS